jgi:hypothetical protein
MRKMTADDVVELGKRVEGALQIQEKICGRPLTDPGKRQILELISSAFRTERGIENDYSEGSGPLVDCFRHAGLH